MTDRQSPFQGRQPTSRHRSPAPDDPQYRYDSLSRASGVYPAGPSRTRPRPSRTGANGSNASHTASPSYVDGERGTTTRTRSSRKTLKKAPRRDSLHTDTASGLQSGQYHGEQHTVGYSPKLNQIREAKGRRRASSQASSTVSSTVEPRTRRRRKRADHAVDPSQVQYNQRMGQPHAPSPPSMASSVPSEVAQESNVSHGSSTTVTNATHEEASSTDDSGSEPETFISEVSEAPNTAITGAPAATSNVFQFMHQTPTIEEYSDEEEHHTRPPSTRQSSSGSSEEDSEHDDEHSLSTGSSQPVRETPTTSPASMRVSRSEASQQASGKHRIAGKPLYASSFVHGHGGHAEEEAEGSEAESEEESDEGGIEDNESPDFHHRPRQDSAMTKVQPPGVQPTSSGHGDEYTWRLRQREQELANHVLQSPQPQKDFQFAGGPSPHPQPTMPLYPPHAYSGASPASFESTAGYHTEWPQFPPPLPIGYPTQPSLESPTAGHALPLTVQPPMGAPSAPVQQRAPPFQQYPGQPPQYQAHVPEPDSTRTTVTGYELLANKLSETLKKSSSLIRKGGGNLVPMYRKFEHLNHRVLLHLQDEVCEMEEELRFLDESIAQMSPRDDAGHAFPASRRNDARYGGELHYKRTELLGRIFQKLGQYNQALTSFNGLVKELDPAGADDIQAYRTWMEKRAPIDFTETRFLDRKNDLLAVSRVAGASANHGGQQQSAVIWLPAMLVLPLLAFAIVPSVLGRLVVIALISGAGFRQITLAAEVLGYMTVQEWSIAVSVYFGFMALLAGLVR